MRKIKIIEHISLDGIIQGPGSPDEDTENGFTLGGWSAPYRDPAAGKIVMDMHSQSFDLLLGRKTYDIWADYWPGVSGNPIADGINAATKYVATHRPESLAWGPAKDLGKDIVKGIRNIKTEDRPDILLWGSSTLTPLLLEHELADEVMLFIYPVLLGKGKKFFADGTAPRALELVGSQSVPSGIVINTFRPAGPAKTGSYT